jgi:hypothetical protein
MLKKLPEEIGGYKLSGMHLPFSTCRAVIATGTSLWMAVLACLMGCTVPILASVGVHNAVAIEQGARCDTSIKLTNAIS